MNTYKYVASQPDEIARGEGPHVWVQWKGTDLCADVRCECGVQSHIDADFCYVVVCPACGRGYGLSMNVAMYPLTAEQLADATRNECLPKMATIYG